MLPLRLGAHLSLGRDPRAALLEASEQGARCVQIFASSPGAWKAPVLHGERSLAIRAATAELDINPLVIHAIYLINLASPDPHLVARSRASLVATLYAAAALGAVGVVTHLGSHGGRGFEAVADQVADGLGAILAQTPPEIDLLLENSAGAGGLIGSTLSEIGYLIQRAGGDGRLQVVLDTAHLTGAGWDFHDPGAAPRLAAEVTAEIGLDRLALLHANDSLVPSGSRRDRHAIVGEGTIGIPGFRHLLDQPDLRRVPWILETPDLGLARDDSQRFASLRRLAAVVEEYELAGSAGSV